MRENLTEFTPALLEALGHTGDPDLALATFDKFLSELPTALQLFAMLRANPNLLQLIAQIMGSAPRLARLLTRRGHHVTLVVPYATELEPDGFELEVDNPWQGRRMTPRCRAHDAVVTQRLPVPTMLALAGTSTPSGSIW